MSGVVAVSGWGQPHDALSELAPTARHIDFARHHSAAAAILEIAAHEPKPDMAIGWSLGGQLLVRAIAAGMLKPRALVLIAAPFQFVKSPAIPIGMPRDLFEKFRANYSHNPERTLGKAWELIHMEDSNARAVRDRLSQQDKKLVMQKDWLRWLDILEESTCDGLSFADFPPTLLIHGDSDKVVYPQQSLSFSKSIPHAKLLSISACGHAPHWHDSKAVAMAIKDYFTNV